jgi:SAM-dependent methyltransferase
MLRIVKKFVPPFIKDALLAYAPHDLIYSEDYYKEVEEAAVIGAGVMSSTIIEQFSPRTVVDVGCGTGALLAAFRDKGCAVRGLEYAEAGLRHCRQRGLDVMKFDIESETPAFDASYDVAISLEVAEHLPASKADRYVGLLCALSPVVICSAAKPGQTGRDHVNLQPQTYWIEKFRDKGHLHDAAEARLLSSRWREARVADWYHENIMVFRKRK